MIVLSEVLLVDSGQCPLGSVGHFIIISKLFLFSSLRSSPQTISAQLTFEEFHGFYFLPRPVGVFVGIFSFHDFKAVVAVISSPVSPESPTSSKTADTTEILPSVAPYSVMIHH